jgi:hypothetical protein
MRQRSLSLPGLNVRAPWAEWLISGEKVIETRSYPLPQKYIGRNIAIVETPGPQAGFSSRVVGVACFGVPFRYSSREEFYRDSKSHLITEESLSYSWEARRGVVWGWPVLNSWPIRQELPANLKKGIVWTNSIVLKNKGEFPVGLF